MHQFEIMPRPPETRAELTPWPTYPLMFRVASAHEEGGERVFSVNTEHFVGENGKVTGLEAHEVEMKVGSFREGRGLATSSSKPISCSSQWASSVPRSRVCSPISVSTSTSAATSPAPSKWATNVDGVFVAGDMGRGQSLIVWAIAEGRSAAAAVDTYLEGVTALPSPIHPTAAPQR